MIEELRITVEAARARVSAPQTWLNTVATWSPYGAP